MGDRSRCGWLAALVIALIGLGAGSGRADPSSEGQLVHIQVRDGSEITARVVEADEDRLVVWSASLGTLTIRRGEVVSIIVVPERGPSRPGTLPPPADPPMEIPTPTATPTPAAAGPVDRTASFRTDPDRNTILLGPTPETLPKGSAYFRNFELLILNFGLAPADAFNLSFGMIFPVTGELVSLSGGFKLRLVDRAADGLGLAVAASGTYLEDGAFGSIIGIAGVGSERSSLNLSIHRSYAENSDALSYFIVGADTQVGPGFKLLAEYANSTRAVTRDEDDFNGFLSVGFRVFGEGSSFTLTGFRPLVDTGSFIAFPVAMYSHQF